MVLLVTDGLDRDPEPGLAAEADRLHRSCRRLIWLNPLLRWEGFEPRAQGVRALLPNVDEHRPVHNLDSLEALGRALAGPATGYFAGVSASSEKRSRRGTRGTKRLIQAKRPRSWKRQRRAKAGRGKTLPARIDIAARCTWSGPWPFRKSSRNEWS